MDGGQANEMDEGQADCLYVSDSKKINEEIFYVSTL